MPFDADTLQALSDARARVTKTFPWTVPELSFTTPTANGATGFAAKRIQEWLSFQGFSTPIDSGYGPATATQVSAFQASAGLQGTGTVDDSTLLALVQPLIDAADPVVREATFGAAVASVANRHLGARPLEIGGDNCGPWVRLYMRGNDGSGWPWCAGFVSFILAQAAAATGTSSPLHYTYSVPELEKFAGYANRLHLGTELDPANAGATVQTPGIFIVRQADGTLSHTGLVLAFSAQSFTTAEGNTNDNGSANGYEAIGRVRGYAGKDFVTVV